MKLVSAIMPTRGRQKYAVVALQCFLSQTHPDKEFLILDDAADLSFPNGPDIPDGSRVRYFVSESRSIPKKINELCRKAEGDIIARFDSDDWSAPERLAHQLQMLEDSGKDAAGFNSMLIWHEVKKAVFRYCGHRLYGMGTSQMFRRSWWEQHRYDESIVLATDHYFWCEARDLKRVVSSDAGKLMVARYHKAQSSVKAIGSSYSPAKVDDLPAGFPRVV